MPDFNPWAAPVFPQGAAFGAGSPAETAQQPSGLDRFLRAAYEGLGNLAQRSFGASEDMRQGGAYNAGPALEAAMLPMGTGAITGVPVRGAEAVLGAGPIRAYHGSPHDFERFDLSKIGTGEGAQAYGHGLYFAEKEGTARSYRDALSGGDPRDKLNEMVQGWTGYRLPNEQATEQMVRNGMRNSTSSHLNKAAADDAIVRDITAYINGISDDLKTVSPGGMDALRRVDKALPQPDKGHMYEVNINANPEHFLDWDATLGQQPKAVQDYFAKQLAQFGPDAPMNAQLKIAASRSGGQQNVSQGLAEAGVPGVRYLDQGSRTVGEGTRNYVVFDDKLIDILKKYGIAGMLGSSALGSAPYFPRSKP